MTIAQHGRSYRIANPGGRIGSKLANGEPYERQLLTDIRRLQFRGVAFDVGAHVGNHSLYLAAICDLEVHAFEPHPASYKQLVANVERNPGILITCHQIALGAEPSRARFREDASWDEFDPTRPDKGALSVGQGSVAVVAVDDYLDVEALAVVKVDVEGMEAEVLTGMRRHLQRSRPVVYAETHKRTQSQRTAAVLEPLGYRMTRGIQMGSKMERWEVTH